MYYKLLNKQGKVVDVLDNLVYLKYQKKHDIMVRCDINEAQAILSSDQNYIYHIDALYDAPEKYETVTLVEIGKKEYDQLRALNLMTPQDIIDEYTLSLIEEGVL